MATENQLVSMAQQFTGLPMMDLIGGPLMAAAEANSQMAFTQASFMLDTCFYTVDDGTNVTYHPIIVSLKLTRQFIDVPDDPAGKLIIEPIESIIELPLITLIPLNSLAVDNVDIKFEMEVKSSYGETETATQKEDFKSQASFAAKASIGPFSVSIKGSVSSSSSSESSQESHYEKSNTAKYTVNVHAGQLPLPGGVKTIVDAYSANITPLMVEKAAP